MVFVIMISNAAFYCSRRFKYMIIIKPGLRSPRYDSRSFIYSERVPPDERLVSPQITIEHDVPIINQGKIVPCCVSIAVTTCLEVLDSNQGQKLSFMYNYYQARDKKDRLSGLGILQGLNAAARYGICTRELHDVSLDRDGANKIPDDAADEDARNRKITLGPHLRWSYEQFEDSNRVKLWRNALQCGIPVIMGFFVTNAYKKIPETGNTHIRPEREQASDGHAVTVMGYNDLHNNQINDPSLTETGAFLIRDSVGNEFPDNNGCWWLPYELAKFSSASSSLVNESWAVIDVS